VISSNRDCSKFSCGSDLSWAFSTEAGSTIWSALFVEIRWATTDLSVLQTKPLTPGLLVTSKEPTSTSTGNSPKPTTNHNNSSGSSDSTTSGLGPGAVAGLVVGILLLATFVAGYAICVLLKRHRQAKPSVTYATNPSDLPEVVQPDFASFATPSPATRTQSLAVDSLTALTYKQDSVVFPPASSVDPANYEYPIPVEHHDRKVYDQGKEMETLLKQ
jgi:hypothetical protein